MLLGAKPVASSMLMAGFCDTHDQVKALRSLDINVVGAKVTSVDSIGWNRFEVTNK
jgi:hypothetical protein